MKNIKILIIILFSFGIFNQSFATDIYFIDIKKRHKTYKNKLNVVGEDIFFGKFKKLKLFNDNTPINFNIS